MVGVAIIFCWGPPQPTMEEGVSLGLEDATKLQDGRTEAEHNEAIRKTRARYHFFSHVGLALVGVGFACQLIAALIAD